MAKSFSLTPGQKSVSNAGPLGWGWIEPTTRGPLKGWITIFTAVDVNVVYARSDGTPFLIPCHSAISVSPDGNAYLGDCNITVIPFDSLEA